MIPVELVSCELSPYYLPQNATVGEGPVFHCLGNKECIAQRSIVGTTTYHSWSMLSLINDTRTERIQRAFSHLIALLQKQYSEKHPDTDPFSK